MLEKIEKPEIETAELKSNGTYGKLFSSLWSVAMVLRSEIV